MQHRQQFEWNVSHDESILLTDRVDMHWRMVPHRNSQRTHREFIFMDRTNSFSKVPHNPC